MATTKHQPIRDRLAELEQALPIAVKERRQRFLEACAYYNLADAKDPPLNEQDTARLDNALERFFAAATMVDEIRHEIAGKNEVLEVAARKGVKF
jgi:hypothetical protein